MKDSVLGNSVTSREGRKSGQTVSEASENKAGKSWNDQDAPDGALICGASHGRTIDLGKFSFVRVNFRVYASALPDDRESVMKWCRSAVTECVEREVASVAQEVRENVEIAIGSVKGYGVGVTVQYGLTVSGPKRYESMKSDVSYTEPVSDNDSFEDALAKALKVAEGELSSEKERLDSIKGDKGNYGI